MVVESSLLPLNLLAAKSSRQQAITVPIPIQIPTKKSGCLSKMPKGGICIYPAERGSCARGRDREKEGGRRDQGGMGLSSEIEKVIGRFISFV
jgi:hypothetical protein